MHFSLVDRIVSVDPDSAVTLKNVSMAEEYLQDHFATFPVLPGVMMVESLVQAARLVLEHWDRDLDHPPRRWVLGKIRALKYGTFVRPGDTLRVEVTRAKPGEDGSHEFKAQATLLGPGSDANPHPVPAVAVAGRLSLRPLRFPEMTGNPG